MGKIVSMAGIPLIGVLSLLLGVAQAQSESINNSITVLAEGYVKPIDGRELIPGATDDGARHVASTVVLIKGKDAIIVADPGLTTNRNLLLDALKKQDVSPDDVTHVFISHHHPDHTVNIALFPNAELVDFWATYKGDLWQDHGDNYVIAPGIRVVRTPGHTHEDASLVVETNDGTYVLTHLWWLPDMTPEADPLAEDQVQLDISRKKILNIADWIIPGHGHPFKNTRRQEN